MLKSLGILAGGIFIGAVGMEVARRACPNGMDKFYGKIGEVTRAAREAFKEGYAGAVRAQPRVPEPTAG